MKGTKKETSSVNFSVQRLSYLLTVVAFFAMASLAAWLPVEADTLITNVTTGTRPSSIGINKVTNKIYVGNESDSSVTVINGNDNTTTTVTVGNTPVAIGVNEVTNKIYVANFNGGNVTIIDGATNSTTPVTVGTKPLDVVVNSSTNKIYVSNRDSNNVTVIDGLTNATTNVALGTQAGDLALNQNTSRVYVTRPFDSSVTVIDGSTLATANVTTGVSPQALDVNPVTNKIYVIEFVGGLTVIDGATNATTSTTTGFSQGQSVAVNPATNKIYIAHARPSGVVTIVNGSDNSTTSINPGQRTYAVAVNPLTNKIYAINNDSTNGTVAVIDGTNNSFELVSTGLNSVAVGVNPNTNRIYVANVNSNNVSVISGTPTPTLGDYPNTTVVLGSDTNVTPNAAPTGALSISVSTNSNFKGTFVADPTTGVVRVTNAHPAGTFVVTVKAFGAGGMTSKTFSLTVTNGTLCNNAVQFANAADVSVGGFPVSVAVGDFNNDGKQDLVTTNVTTNTASIRLGNGLGGFSGVTEVSVGSTPRFLAVGDFNNDGKQDFATANQSANTVSIRLGDGLGGFSGTTEVSVDASPFGVAIGDFNSDGNQDFVTANNTANTVSVRLGDGLGGFSGTTNVSVGTNPLKVAIGDFNNDGKQDLANVNNGANSVSIRLGDGLGGFSGTTEVSIGSGPRNLAIGDFNNDGNQDFAATNAVSASVSIRLGNGSGSFSGTTEISTGSSPQGIAIGDFNNDGNQDFASGNQLSNAVSIRVGNGSGGFSGTSEVTVGSQPVLPAIGDFNNDGKQDLAVTNAGANTASIRLGGCSAPGCTPPPSGMVGWWPGDGNPLDISGGGNNGSFEGTTAYSAGKVAQAFSLNGTNGDVKIPASASLNVGLGNGMAFDTWINPLGTAKAQPIIEWNNNLGVGNGLPPFGYGTHMWLSVGNSALTPGSIYVNFFGSGGDHVVYTNPGVVPAGSWSHVAATYDKTSGDARIYINGTAVALNGTANTTINFGQFTAETSYDLYFGVRISSANPGEAGTRFTRGIDEVELLNRALTATEVANIYDAGSFGKCKPANLSGTITFVGGNGNGSAVGAVTVALSGTQTSTTTDITGHYSFTNLPIGSYTLTPSRTNYTFAPDHRDVILNGVDQTSNFTATTPTAADGNIGGTITDAGGSAIGGVTITLSGTESRVAITDATGRYDFDNVETNGFYTVTPARANYTFSPANRSFSLLGVHTEASFTATANGDQANAIDTIEFFVRQHYVDFLGREPDPPGFIGWVNTLRNCAPGDTSCDRVHVSEAFFRSQEFQERGYFVYRFYSVALGRKPDYAEFTPDLARVSGFLSNDQLAAAKSAFVNDFTSRPAFVAAYNSLSNAAYVDTLLATAGVTPTNRQALIESLNNSTSTRAQVLRQIAESGEVNQRYYNQAFVVMEYFGYLRRNPDALYLNWIQVLDANPADSRHMVDGFVNSAEYRIRFAQ